MPPTNRPVREKRDGPIPPDAVRVLLTGFGPFCGFETHNPSWQATSVLHDNILHEPGARSIHITAVEVPVVYTTVLSAVPLFHASPPQITLPIHGTDGLPPPPSAGYDFIFHVGVGQAGGLAIEQLAHKTGYPRKDADGKFAPPIKTEGALQSTQDILSATAAANRGFGKGYEEFSDELKPLIDTEGLVKHLKERGFKHVRLSTDAGRYVCEFILYCSLAESLRSRPDDLIQRAKVLFMHVPPQGEPCSLEEMTNAAEEVIRWVCSTISTSHPGTRL